MRKSVVGTIHELATMSASAAASIAGMLAAPCGAAIDAAAYTAKTTRFDSAERIRHQTTLAPHAWRSGTPLESKARLPKRASARATDAAASVIATGISSAYQ